jgi:hypothetical protein
MRRREAYPRLYQESAGRQTLDKTITMLRDAVGGGCGQLDLELPLAAAHARALEYGPRTRDHD